MTEKKIRSQHTDQIYDNCQMFDDEGNFMCWVSKKRGNWYLKRNLAVPIEDGIQLTFKPRGKGHAGDDYYEEKRENRCVVCGTTEKLTRHHVVPHQYRQFLENKNRSHFDVLCVCAGCHDDYEKVATEKNKELAKTFNIQVNTTQSEEVKDKSKHNAFVATLLKYQDQIPEQRKKDMLDEIERISGKRELVQIPTGEENKRGVTGLEILTKWLENNTELDFIVMWRQHFLDTTSPRFMSRSWLESYKDRIK